MHTCVGKERGLPDGQLTKKQQDTFLLARVQSCPQNAGWREACGESLRGLSVLAWGLACVVSASPAQAGKAPPSLVQLHASTGAKHTATGAKRGAMPVANPLKPTGKAKPKRVTGVVTKKAVTERTATKKAVFKQPSVTTTPVSGVPHRIASPVASSSVKQPANNQPASSVAYRWLDIALEATAREVDLHGARPTILSRTLAIVTTAMYDAWAAYDDVAVSTRPHEDWRRPAAERTDANREKAVAYAAYRALLYVYPDDAAWCTERMAQLGLVPQDNSLDCSTPQGVGNAAAAAVIDFRRHDGANQGGDATSTVNYVMVSGTSAPSSTSGENPSAASQSTALQNAPSSGALSPGLAYADYTSYQPINSPTQVVDPNRWQTIPFSNGKGGTVRPGFLTPHWGLVRPFALERGDQFRPAPPPLVGSEQLKREVDEVLAYNASLTPQQKAVVEFMRDGPRSTGQSGHWLRFAQAVSRRDRNGLDQDIKLFFAVANVAMDAFIAAWDAKRYYDTSRPWTLVRHYYAGQQVMGWAGPGQGCKMLPAEQWHPYSVQTFVTPPFPGYVSGHSAVSAACARMLELFTGSDRFGVVEARKAGELTEPGVNCQVMQGRDGQPSLDTSLSCDVALPLPTFSATAEMAGLSRVMGGYHIQADNVAGLQMGRQVAVYVWPKIQSYFVGRAVPEEQGQGAGQRPVSAAIERPRVPSPSDPG
jgi:hypothetical protein